MADFLNYFIPGPAVDSIAIYDQNFNQLFANARPMKCEVAPRAKVMDHPLETGQIISDYKIVLPIEINIPLFVPAKYYRDVYQQLWITWQTSQLLTVQTRVSNYGNMIISEMPDEQTPEKFTATTIFLKLRQVQLVNTIPAFSPADPTNNDTQPLGQQAGYTVSGIQTDQGEESITFGDTFYSSVPPSPSSTQISGVQTLNGVQTIPVPSSSVAVTGVQALTPQTSIAAGFR